MSEHLRWEKGGEAVFLSLEGEAVRLSSTVPSPPGSRIDGALCADATVRVRVKIHSAKRQGDGRFVLEGRMIDMTRAHRDVLLALLAEERGASST